MTRQFRSESCMHVGYSEEDEEEERVFEDHENGDYCEVFSNPISTPFISLESRRANGGKKAELTIFDFLMAALRKSVVTCGVETEDVSSSMDISSPTNVRHVSHVTFDRFNGFKGLPRDLQPEVSQMAPCASTSVFGVSAKSMQCSFDSRGNSVPTILLMMQRQLYSEGGLKAEGIFRINAENGHEESARDKLNKGVVPCGIGVHILAGLIKAWFRELPTRVLDSLTQEQVMHCNTEDDCTQLVKLLPQTEAALLDWAINLMADVVHYEPFNKMNARNIAMVFAPNMTQMADHLNALIHAVQVMNILKTLILKTLREREEADVKFQSSCSVSLGQKSYHMSSNSDKVESFEKLLDVCAHELPARTHFFKTTITDRLQKKI